MHVEKGTGTHFFNLHAEFETKCTKDEAKIQFFYEEMKDRWLKYENEIKLMMNANHLKFLMKELKTEKRR